MAMSGDGRPQAGSYGVGDWCRHTRYTAPCRIIDRQSIWTETVFRVWLPTKDAIIRARESDLAPLSSLRPTENEILHTAAAAKLLDALEDNLLLAPIQSSVVPLPHQLYALNKALCGNGAGSGSRGRVRYLLADEVGLGKTIEAGLILRELKLRGMVRRVLVVAPKSLVRQWQAEMRLHFGESFRLIEPSELASLRSFASSAVPGDRPGAGERDDNLWLMHDQVICSIDLGLVRWKAGEAGAWIGWLRTTGSASRTWAPLPGTWSSWTNPIASAAAPSRWRATGSAPRWPRRRPICCGSKPHPTRARRTPSCG